MLIRSDVGNWCIINEGSPPAIVMGISGKAEELIDMSKVLTFPIPVIKRFSGGGTVVIDENTLFITFICEKELHDFPAYPEPILKWTEELYKEVFNHPEFSLRENDYVIGERKLGGNAQYIKKHRWLHHTSFLWDYAPEKMEYLLHPRKKPTYRKERTHVEFLCRLSEYFSDKEKWIDSFLNTLKKQFCLESISLEEALKKREGTTRQTTCLLPLASFQVCHRN